MQVVANCVVVLNEIMADAGGMATNTAIVHHLLGRLEDFNEWGVCHILALVSRLDERRLSKIPVASRGGWGKCPSQYNAADGPFLSCRLSIKTLRVM